MIRLQRKYSSEDASLLKERIQEVKVSMQALENAEPKSHHEVIEKKKLLEVYGKEIGKFVNTVHDLQEPPLQVVHDEKIQAVAYEDEHIIEKAKELKVIEKHIIDINHMLKDCAETILDQGKDLDTVENFVEISYDSTKEAVNELEKANGYQKNSSNCCFYAIGVIIVLCLALIIFYSL